MPKVNDMIPSKFLKKEDVGNGKLVTVKAIEQENVAMDNQPADMKYTLVFNELKKPLVLNSTNIQLAASIFASQDTDDWMGKPLVLYVDPNVSFGGQVVGGIRVRAPKPGAQMPETVTTEDHFDDDIPF